MFTLLLFTAWILGTIAVHFFSQRSKVFSLGEWALLVFVAGLVLSVLFSNIKYTALFGASHRNNGVLTYLALAVMAFAAMYTFDLKSLYLYRSALLLIGAISTIYGLLQTTGHDPVKWNLYYKKPKTQIQKSF